MKRILVVDDEPHVTRLVAQRLSREGYETRTAGNGLEALSCFDSDGPFDVLITDYNMPKMDGRELCENVRERFSKDELHIFLVTARAEDPLRDWAGGAPCVEYIEKPISLQDLVRRLEKCFSAAEAEGESVGESTDA